MAKDKALINLGLLIMMMSSLSSLQLGDAREQNTEKIDFKDLTLVQDFILGDSKNEIFLLPVSIATDNSRRIYVADREKNSVLLFSKEGTYIQSLSGDKKENFRLKRPALIGIDLDGTLYVVEISRTSQKVVAISKEHKVLRSFALPFPPGKVSLSNEALFVNSKSSEYNIYKYSKEGKLVAQYDHVLNMEEEKARTSFALDVKGNLYLARTFIPKVKILAPDGKELSSFDYRPTIANQQLPIQLIQTYGARRGNQLGFTVQSREYPVCYDISVDRYGFLYLLVAQDHEQPGLCALWRFDPEGKFIYKADLPFRCGRIYIDQYDEFIFVGTSAAPAVYCYHAERLEKERG